MSLNITSRKFKNDQNEEVSFLLGNANNYVKAIYRFAVEYDVVLNPSQSLIVSGTILTLIGANWEDFGFVVGTSNLDIVNVNGYSTTRNITIIDGNQLQVDSGFGTDIPDGNYTVGTLICDAKVDGANVEFNFCKNSLSSGSSLIDNESTRFTVDGLDALSIGATVTMVQLGNRSGLSKILATIEKVSSSPKLYEITLITFISPFHNNVGFFASESLASWLKVEALPDFNNPNVKISRIDKYNGNVGYFNENFNGFPSNFVKDSISWEDDYNNSIDALDYTQASNFTARINGAFTSGSRFQFYAFFPSNQNEDFSNLPTDASKNFISTTETNYKVVATNYNFTSEVHPSGAYLTYTNIRFEQFSTYVIITGKITPSADFTTLINSRDSSNRNYRIWVRCENPALDFNSSDMVNVEIDNSTMTKNVQPLGTFDPITDELKDHNNDLITDTCTTCDTILVTYTLVGEEPVTVEVEGYSLIGGRYRYNPVTIDGEIFTIRYSTIWVLLGQGSSGLQATLSEDTPCPFGTYTIEEGSIFEAFEVTPSSTCGFRVITEDDVRRETIFTIERNDATITELNARIIAKNTVTNESFELEKFSVNLNSLPFLPNGTKPINSIQNRPFNIPSNALMNQVKFERATSEDTLTKYGVSIKHPFLCRWEYWLQQLNASLDFYDSKNKDWRHYQDVANWKIISIIGIVKGDGEYQNPKIIPIRNYDDAEIQYTIEFFKLDNTALTTPIDDIVRVKITHEKSGVTTSWGTITVEPFENSPRWLISTEYNQTDPSYPLQPLSGETKLKQTISTDDVVFECLFDGRLFNKVKFTSRLQVLS
jgi:hypothetical protein